MGRARGCYGTQQVRTGMLRNVLWDVWDRPPQQRTVGPNVSTSPTRRNPDLDPGMARVSHMLEMGCHGVCVSQIKTKRKKNERKPLLADERQSGRGEAGAENATDSPVLAARETSAIGLAPFIFPERRSSWPEAEDLQLCLESPGALEINQRWAIGQGGVGMGRSERLSLDLRLNPGFVPLELCSCGQVSSSLLDASLSANQG